MTTLVLYGAVVLLALWVGWLLEEAIFTELATARDDTERAARD